MWIQTPGSFVSIVNDHDDPHTVVIRARARVHLERFLDYEEHTRNKTHKPFIHEDKKGERDYQFRAYLPREDATRLVGSKVMQMGYTNFKDASKAVDPEVTHMFEDWWQDHYNFQESRRKR